MHGINLMSTQVMHTLCPAAAVAQQSETAMIAVLSGMLSQHCTHHLSYTPYNHGNMSVLRTPATALLQSTPGVALCDVLLSLSTAAVTHLAHGVASPSAAGLINDCVYT